MQLSNNYVAQMVSVKFFCCILHCFFSLIFRHFYRSRSRGDNTFGSVRLCVCPSVCLWALSCLTFDLDFGLRVDLGYPEIVVQGRRSKVKVKQ